MNKNKSIITLLILQPFLMSIVLANTIDTYQQYDLTRQIVTNKYAKENDSVSITTNINDPQLQQKLDYAINSNDIENIRLLLPIYERSSNPNKNLITFSKAIIYREQGNIPKAKKYFLEMLRENPSYSPVRLQLAKALIVNKEYESAKKELDAIGKIKNIPKPIINLIDTYELYIKKYQNWFIDIGVAYIFNDNVNQAPDKSNVSFANGTLSLPDKKQGRGLSYYAYTNKNIFIENNWFLLFNSTLDGTSYWNAHNYDDIINRFYSGISYKTANTEIDVTPFYENRWKANKSYSKMPGIRLSLSHSILNNTQIITSFDSGLLFFDKTPELNGNSHSLSVSGMHQISPSQLLIVGYDFSHNNSKENSSTYTRNGVRLGWIQNWPKEITTKFFTSIAKRNYRSPDFLDIKRKDTEYYIKTSILKKNWNWNGFTPQLSFSWNKIKSNHFLYGYKNTNITFGISKQF